ncbi:hypothetical protein Glove_78g174 [Diversispora epigaea]|uniref:Uncharacterized protein n=1 Tax=Diversispora epigaea TaxID=1348612 RepID=A0A397JC75_9GLOM|nr:hypothetical protein Glove_78g174 [Diversispora epigaea]
MKSDVQFCWMNSLHPLSQFPNIESDQKENDSEAINNEQNLDEKRVEEKLVKRYNLRERQEINYTEISSSDIIKHLTPHQTTPIRLYH